MAFSQSWPAKRRRTRPICAKICEGAQYGATYQASMSDFRSDWGSTLCSNHNSSSHSWSLFRNGLNCWILISVISYHFLILLFLTTCPIIVVITSIHSAGLLQDSYHCPAEFARSYTHYAKFVGKRLFADF